MQSKPQRGKGPIVAMVIGLHVHRVAILKRVDASP